MSEDSMLMCLIAFVLGYLFSRMMRGNGLLINPDSEIKDELELDDNINFDEFCTYIKSDALTVDKRNNYCEQLSGGTSCKFGWNQVTDTVYNKYCKPPS